MPLEAFDFSCVVTLPDGLSAEVQQTDIQGGIRQDVTFFVSVRPHAQKAFTVRAESESLFVRCSLSFTSTAAFSALDAGVRSASEPLGLGAASRVGALASAREEAGRRVPADPRRGPTWAARLAGCPRRSYS